MLDQIEGARSWPQALSSFDIRVKGPCRNFYEHLHPIGNIEYTIPLGKPGNTTLHLVSDVYTDYVSYSGITPIEPIYDGVQGTSDNVWKSIYKFDVEPKLNVCLEEWERAWARTSRQLELPFSVDILLEPIIDPKTSPTFPYSSFGFDNKGDVMSRPEFWEIVYDIRMPAITRCVSKREFLPLVEIRENKIRTFLFTSLHHLYWQMVFGKNQDTGLCIYRSGGIEYGITFQGGGFDRLCKSLEGKYCHTWDVKGWDRKLPLMKAIWLLRSKFLKCPDWANRFFAWCAYHTVNSLVLLPNGDVVLKRVGNNSGSGTTTGDNCVGHLIVNNYMDCILEAILNEDLDIINKIYSDDLIKALDYILSEEFVVDLYAQFGMEIQDFQVRFGPEGVCFLGAEASKISYFGKHYYVPKYNIDRLNSSMQWMLELQTPDEQCMKFYSLMHLGVLHDSFFSQIRSLILYVLSKKEYKGPFIDQLRRAGVPSRDEIILGFWLGLEASDKILPEVSDFFLVQKEVGGF